MSLRVATFTTTLGALAACLGACEAVSPEASLASASASEPKARGDNVASVYRSFRPIDTGPTFEIPASAQVVKASGMEGPSGEVRGTNWKIIFAVSPTISLKGLGVGKVISRQRSTRVPGLEVVKFVPDPAIPGFGVSVAGLIALPADPRPSPPLKLLVQGLCNSSDACDEVEKVLLSAR